jgi:choline dehydrogenase-like flavoprotein
VTDAESPIAISIFSAVGGSPFLSAGHFPRMKPSDFRVRRHDGVADDWPLDYATLEPYWAENDRLMGVAGLAGDPAYPPKEPTLPPVPLGKLGETVARGFDELGWHWWPSDSAIATRPYGDRAPCINLGPCVSGCAQGAKASTDLTYWPAAIRNGVRLETRCRVREITVRPDGLADGVIYYDADGIERRQRAEIVVLACNGVGTPRLLLNSRSRQFPDGLANRNGLVGRNLMFHPYGMVMGLFDEPLDGYQGPTGCGLMSHEFYETDRARGFVRGFSFELLRGFGPVTTALWGLTSGRVSWGPDHHRGFGEVIDRMAGLIAICEDLPEEHNRVVLDPDLTDGHGIPAPKIEYRLSDNSRRILDFGVERGKQALMAAGARSTFVEAPLRIAGWHLMGTARMGRDPARSVVDEGGRAHDVRNLFVIDGSVFVTAGAVNPTCTIQGLALYIADRIKKNLGNLFD